MNESTYVMYLCDFVYPSYGVFCSNDILAVISLLGTQIDFNNITLVETSNLLFQCMEFFIDIFNSNYDNSKNGKKHRN